jgi:predicted MFS family arabinose efflux permease
MTPASTGRDDFRDAPGPYLAGAVLLAVAMGIGRFAYTPLLVVMRADAGLTVPAAGVLASANLAGYLAGALIAMLPVMNARRTRVIALASFGVAALTAAMAGPAWTWLTVRFLTGVASGFVFVLTVSLMLELAKARGSRWGLPIFFSGVGSGIALAGAAVPVLARFGGSRGTWIALGVACAVAVAFAVRALPRGGPVAAGTSGAVGAAGTSAPARSAGSDLFWWLAVLYGVEGGAYIVPGTFLVAMVAETPSLAALAQYTWVVVGLAAVPSVVLWSAVAARTGQGAGLICACVAQGLALLVPSVVDPAAGAVILAVALGGTFIGITALGTSLGRSSWPGDGNTAVGLLTVLYGIGQIAGPLVATHIALTTGSYRAALPVAAIALLLPSAAFAIRLALARPRTA